MNMAKKLLLALLASVALIPAMAQNLDHYKVYQVQPQVVNAPVDLLGQFETDFKPAWVYEYNRHLNPVSKNGEGILRQNAHLSWYTIETEAEPARQVIIQNQFGLQEFIIQEAVALLVPTEKLEPGSSFPNFLDHYKVYRVVQANPVFRPVFLQDQWCQEQNEAMQPEYFAVPVEKLHNGQWFPINNPDDHLVFYNLEPTPWNFFHWTSDQFGFKPMTTTNTELLGVPSFKLGWQ